MGIVKAAFATRTAGATASTTAHIATAAAGGITACCAACRARVLTVTFSCREKWALINKFKTTGILYIAFIQTKITYFFSYCILEIASTKVLRDGKNTDG